MSNVIIDAQINRKTERAIRVNVDGRAVWLPISKLSPLSPRQRDEYWRQRHTDWQYWQNTDEPADVLLSIPQWLARKNGI